MTFLIRSTILTRPALSIAAISPVWNQPSSSMDFLVFSGSRWYREIKMGPPIRSLYAGYHQDGNGLIEGSVLLTLLEGKACR